MNIQLNKILEERMGKKTGSCLNATGGALGCCKVQSLISVDERGQMVLPKEMRDKANIRPGDKLALISWEKDGKVCCISMVKAEDFGDMVKGLLGPMMKEIVGPSQS
jgi:AbrB family looped-hinge helix DNA binding protein